MVDFDYLRERFDERSAGREAERLILDTTELILELMERDGVTRKQLADRIGKSKGHVSQLLNGDRNMTLRTLAEIGFALNRRFEVADTGARNAARTESFHPTWLYVVESITKSQVPQHGIGSVGGEYKPEYQRLYGQLAFSTMTPTVESGRESSYAA
jgi:transcriptional regulator with XRE-family HTH domain